MKSARQLLIEWWKKPMPYTASEPDTATRLANDIIAPAVCGRNYARKRRGRTRQSLPVFRWAIC